MPVLGAAKRIPVNCEEKRGENFSFGMAKLPRSPAVALLPSTLDKASGRHCCDGAGFVNGAGVRPMNEVPVNFPLPSKFQVNSAVPALAQVGHPLRSG